MPPSAKLIRGVNVPSSCRTFRYWYVRGLLCLCNVLGGEEVLRGDVAAVCAYGQPRAAQKSRGRWQTFLRMLLYGMVAFRSYFEEECCQVTTGSFSSEALLFCVGSYSEGDGV